MLDALHETEHDPSVAFFDDPAKEDELWAVREAGLGATAHVPRRAGHLGGLGGLGRAAGPARRLPARPAEAVRRVRLQRRCVPSLYGHFGQGCVHTRIPFDLYSTEGVANYRRFMEQRRRPGRVATAGRCPASTATARPAASCCRGCSAPEIVGAFGELKAIFDPGDRMNPGKVVHPARLDEHLRLGGDWAPRHAAGPVLPLPDDGGSFAQAANRCVGVGKCRQHDNKGGTVMCPSYQVTQRGGALHARAGPAAVRDARRPRRLAGQGRLALARRCATRSTCAWPARAARPTARPTSTWRRTRPSSSPTTGTAASGGGRASDYALGWLPLAARAVSRLRLAPVVNALTHTPAAAPRRHAARRPRAPRGAAVRRRDAAAVVRAPRAARRRAPRHRAAVAGHVHQPLPPARRPGRRRGARERGLAGAIPRSRSAAG